jgi:hypothetical protein
MPIFAAVGRTVEDVAVCAVWDGMLGRLYEVADGVVELVEGTDEAPAEVVADVVDNSVAPEDEDRVTAEVEVDAAVDWSAFFSLM